MTTDPLSTNPFPLSPIADDDRVLVAYVPKPTDFLLIETAGWYRIPQASAPKGVFAEWIAFYFGASFGEQKYAIHVVAQNLGHELVTRRELMPHQPNHKRADTVYYKIQLGELIWLDKPIVSLKWRRLLFLHTTGDRFKIAREVNDLLVEGGDFVNRKHVALREEEENYQ